MIPPGFERTSSVVSSNGGQACLLDGHGKIVWVNEVWRLIGSPISVGLQCGDDYLGACRRARRSWRGIDEFERGLVSLLREDLDHVEAEFVSTDDDSDDVRILARGQAIVIDRMRCAMVMHDDVTTVRRAEQALQASEERYRQFFDAAPDAVFLLSGEPEDRGRILDANELAGAMHGYSREELLSMTIMDLDAPEDGERAAGRIEKLLRDGSISFDVRHRHRDGHEFPVEVSARTATIGGRRCIVSFNRDSTERHRYESELAEQRIRLGLAARASQVGFWDWEVATGRVLLSDEWKAQIGYLPHELEDDFEEWRKRVHPEDLPSALEAVERHLRGETEVYTTEFRFRHRDGSWRWIYVRGEASRDEQGNAKRFVGCHVDITEQKQAEQQRVEFAQRLSSSQRLESIGTLAGGIAHDINNILAIISANVELTALATKDTNVLESMAEIQKASDRAGSLVRQVLTFSRGDRAERRRVDLAPIVDEAVRLVRSATPKRVRIQGVVEAGVPDVSADAEQLHQVLVNLGTNAWHAIGDSSGCVEFRVRSGPLPTDVGGPDLIRVDGDYAIIEVHDDGAGIESALIERIFEPFFTTKESGHGTGLGLSVAHGIVANHGGALDVESEPGVLTTFRIYLPPAAAEEPAVRATIRKPASSCARVLLVDDELCLLSVLEKGLERFGIRVTTDTEPARALDRLRLDPQAFDVFITDFDMPGSDGIETARLAREIRPDLPVVLCSGFLDGLSTERARAVGVTRTLAKPIVPSELAAAIRELV